MSLWRSNILSLAMVAGRPRTLDMESQSTSADLAPQGLRRLLMMPEIPRVLPFLLFVGLGSLQGKFFDGSEYWMYALKTVLVGALLWSLRGYIPEMKWAFSWSAVVLGVAIAGLWIGLGGLVPTLAELWGDARHHRKNS
jgi:hypothetical protein